MSGIFISLACISFIGFIIFLVRKHKRKAKPKSRKPYALTNPIKQQLNCIPVTTQVTKSSSSSRLPRPTFDRDYLNYRFCPDCHSENEYNKQVIFKTSDSTYSCKICGCKFNSYGDSI